MQTIHNLLRNLCGLAFPMYALCAAADTAPTTWSGTDELNRTLPLHGDAATRPYDHTVDVGMFYYLWHGTEPRMTDTYDVSLILAADSINPQWGPDRYYHWGSRPWLGYYAGGDRDVIDRHLQMLCDAGVDFLVFDCTNGPIYPTQVNAVIESIRSRQNRGQRFPKLVAMVHSRQNEAITALWDHFYANPALADLWYEVDGRPLLLCDLEQPQFSGRLADSILPHFTLRHSWAWTGGRENTWSWLDFYPQGIGYTVGADGRAIPEAISVSAAQHATTAIGKSFHDGAQPQVDQQGLCAETPQGLYFAEQWERALSLPDSLRVPVLMITQWNEHIAMRFISGDPTGADPGKTRPGATPASDESYFVDVYNAEFNRDLEPSSHPLIRDNYYMQLVDGIRRYRGVQPLNAPICRRTIDIHGPFSQWDAEPLAFADDRGDHIYGNRDATETPNDIILCKAASDSRNMYFMAQTADALRLESPADMQLLIDTDADHTTGWHGFDCMAMYDPAAARYILHRYNQDATTWEPTGTVSHRKEDNRLMLALSRQRLGIRKDGPVDFKWLDSCPAVQAGEPMLMYSAGECAPNHRFTYRLLPPVRR